MLEKWDRILNKKVYKIVSERAEGYCEVCGVFKGDSLELHHILRRKVEANEYNCIMLCYEHHRGTGGCHGRDGRELDLKLKRQLQQTYIEQGYTENEVREKMAGRLY